jgi:DNA-directed RNA polymerase specialized sigma24 family protein
VFEGVDDETLLGLMRAGDREAAAAFLLRRRAALQRWTDRKAGSAGDDLLSTVLRRFDRLVERGRFQGHTEGDAWRIVVSIGRRSLANIARRAVTHRKAVEALGATRAMAALPPADPPTPFDSATLRQLVAGLGHEDYLVLVGKLEGRRSREIAAALGGSEEAVRTRWSRLRRMLISQLAA